MKKLINLFTGLYMVLIIFSQGIPVESAFSHLNLNEALKVTRHSNHSPAEDCPCSGRTTHCHAEHSVKVIKPVLTSTATIVSRTHYKFKIAKPSEAVKLMCLMKKKSPVFSSVPIYIKKQTFLI